MPKLSFPGAETVAVGAVPVLWLPPHVALSDDSLLTAEDHLLAAPIKAETRKLEFLRSRFLIRKLTGWQGTLAKARDGAPGWPEGWTGSLTHKDGWVGLALSRDQATSVGIDAEDVGRLKAAFESKILNAAESSRLDGWSEGDATKRLEVLAACFSFKEALFKAVYPLGSKMFHFPDAELTRFERKTGEIDARLLIDTSPVTPAGAVVTGHFVTWKRDGRHFVLTSARLHRVANGGIRNFDHPLG